MYTLGDAAAVIRHRATTNGTSVVDAVSEDARAQAPYYGPHGGYGRYTWRHVHGDLPPEVGMLEEVKAHGAGWTPLLHGLFGGDPDRAEAALASVGEMAKHVRSRMW